MPNRSVVVELRTQVSSQLAGIKQTQATPGKSLGALFCVLICDRL